MDEAKEELTKDILSEGEDITFDEEEFKLSEEEEELIDNIGTENFDYCVTALLQHRHPNRDLVLEEEDEVIVIDDTIELEFNPDVWVMQNDHPKDAITDAVGYISIVFMENIKQFVEEE